MVDYSVFDSNLDSVFVVDAGGKIVYCNEPGAAICGTSVRRLIGKAQLSDYVAFKAEGVIPFTANSPGYASTSPMIETEFTVEKAAKSGKVQMTIGPITEGNWIFFLHDVGLEETLAAKYKAELAKTEEYARNLEKLVEARTGELREVNRTLNAILDSLGQGFFTFNSQGDCGTVFTKACEDILEGIPKDHKAWEVLKLAGKDEEQFRKWMDTSFKEMLPFDDLKSLGPSLFAHTGDRRVVLDYYPIRREKTISDIVVVATDKTAEHQAQMALEAERQYAAMVVKYLKNKDQFLNFLSSVRVSLAHLQQAAQKPLTAATISESFRMLHTVEGEAGIFSMRDLRVWARESQQILEPYKAQASVPADVQAKYCGSLATLSTQFEKFLSDNDSIIHVPKDGPALTAEVPLASIHSFLDDLKRSPLSAELCDSYNDIFLKVPIESRLKYFDSLVQTVAEKLGKKMKPVRIEGGEFRIFPEPYQKFFSSLVHAFRNAVDHGIEDPTEREWNGKDPSGEVRVNVTPSGLGMTIVISDDGKGIDPQVIREKLKKKFPDRDFSTESDEEVIQNVFLPGFSSRDEIGEFSGRGVGLDALREETLIMGGSVRIKSKQGQGTSIEIFIPEQGAKTGLLRSA